MQHLNIKTPERTISIDLCGGDMSIVFDQDKRQPTAPATLEWSNTLLNGKEVTYAKAEEAIAELGDGWRLPTRQELESLIDLSRHDPAIDTEKYPDTKSACYWTSTPCAWNAEAAVWVVYFSLGGVAGYPRGNDACVRAVRAGQ